MVESRTSLPCSAGDAVDAVDADADAGDADVDADPGAAGGAGSGETNISRQPLLSSSVSLFSETKILNPIGVNQYSFWFLSVPFLCYISLLSHICM